MRYTARQKAVFKRRLLALARLLRRVPRNRFRMDVWVGDDWRGDKTLSCGTSACALGWAATIPSLQRAVLELVGTPGPTVGWRDPRRRKRPPILDPTRAALEVFGVAVEDFATLFTPGLKAVETPLGKAKQIEQLVRGGDLWRG